MLRSKGILGLQHAREIVETFISDLKGAMKYI
jgi:hypothetical protein